MGWRTTVIAAENIISGWIGVAAGAALPVDDHAFSIARGRAPRILAAGAEIRVNLEIGNEGRRTWRADGSFAVSYHWLDSDGAVTYTPNSGFVGVDGFTYLINAGMADSDIVEVTIIVVNVAPSLGILTVEPAKMFLFKDHLK